MYESCDSYEGGGVEEMSGFVKQEGLMRLRFGRGDVVKGPGSEGSPKGTEVRW